MWSRKAGTSKYYWGGIIALLLLWCADFSFAQETLQPEQDPADTAQPVASPQVAPANLLPESSPNSAPDDPAYELAKECFVTNVFYDTDVREILTAMAAQCYVNVIADETVSGLLTVEIEDLPLEEAMRRVLSPFGLTYKWMGGYYLVGSARPDNPSYPLLARTELYRPRHIKAVDIPKLMSKYYEPFLLVNSETNTVSLSGAPETIAAMKEDLAQIDLPPRQIMIEALVTEATSDVNRELGVSWTYQGKMTDADKSFRIEAYPQTSPTSDSTISGFLQRIGIRSDNWLTDYRIKLSAFEEKGKARIRANPRIATLEGSQARIFVGREEYFTIVTGSVAYAYAQLEVIKTGISLTITPYVSDNGEITLDVEPWVSDVIGSGSTGLPVTSMRSVTTKVRVQQGETVVIGGLKVQNRQEIQRRIPLLGSIPILGYLFRHTGTAVTESEITVLITPYIWVPEPVTED